MEMAKYLDVRQFAARSGLPVSTIERFIREKKLPVTNVGRRNFIESIQLDKLAEIIGTKPIEKAVGGVDV